mmetsp:Transcript_51464/g.92429  ORF Transcript_51464/g.92429 Transcript_51464/m.92429 type:complete len:81 (+) Transcript_51464:159-401(+)
MPLRVPRGYRLPRAQLHELLAGLLAAWQFQALEKADEEVALAWLHERPPSRCYEKLPGSLPAKFAAKWHVKLGSGAVAVG